MHKQSDAPLGGAFIHIFENNVKDALPKMPRWLYAEVALWL